MWYLFGTRKDHVDSFGDAGEHHDDNKPEVKRHGHSVFGQINNMRKTQPSDRQEIENAGYNDTWCGRLAKDKRFEVLTMIVISLNAIVIGYDADYTARYTRASALFDDEPQFIIFEFFFAIYFSIELGIRFFALKRKCDCLYDRWFVFDSILVAMMVVETFVIECIVRPLANSGGAEMSGASVLRLLRLLRITRMSRLMRNFPELMTIIKGLAASVKGVFWTGVILFLLTYTWAILFTSEFHQGRDSDSDISDCAGGEENMTEELGKTLHDCNVQVFFGSMGKSMASLLVMGAVLDDVTACSDAIRKSKSSHFIAFFILYIIFASFTLLNMLTGILCEVVNASAETEKIKASEGKLRDAIKSIESEIKKADEDSDGTISRAEFAKIVERAKKEDENKHQTKKKKKDEDPILNALTELEIDTTEINKYFEYFFPPRADGKEESIKVKDMTQAIMRTRPGMPVGALDMAIVKQVVIQSYSQAQGAMKQIQDLLDGVGAPSEGTQPSSPVVASAPGQSWEGGGRSENGQAGAVVRPAPAGAVQQNSPGQTDKGVNRTMSIKNMQQLERTPTLHIIRELQRRLLVADLQKTQVPLKMMDKEMQEQVKAFHFAPLGVPQQEPSPIPGATDGGEALSSAHDPGLWGEGTRTA